MYSAMSTSRSKICPSVSTTWVAIGNASCPDAYPFRVKNSTSGPLIPYVLREPFGRNISADAFFLRLVVNRRADGGELDAHDAQVQKPARLPVARPALRLAREHVGERRHLEDLRARRAARQSRLLLRLAGDVAPQTVRLVKGARPP